MAWVTNSQHFIYMAWTTSSQRLIYMAWVTSSRLIYMVTGSPVKTCVFTCTPHRSSRCRHPRLQSVHDDHLCCWIQVKTCAATCTPYRSSWSRHQTTQCTHNDYLYCWLQVKTCAVTCTPYRSSWCRHQTTCPRWPHVTRPWSTSDHAWLHTSLRPRCHTWLNWQVGLPERCTWNDTESVDYAT